MAGVGQTASLEALRDDARACARCRLALKPGGIVFGEGPAPAPLMIVGEAPGESETIQRRPFVGPAGKVLDRMLAQTGLARDAAFLTNTVLHRPTNRLDKDRPPSTDEVAACSMWLDAQLALVRPRVVLALGDTATKRLLGAHTRLEDVQGRAQRCGDRWVVPTFHPSGLNRAEGRREAFRSALDVAARLLGPTGRGRSSSDVGGE